MLTKEHQITWLLLNTVLGEINDELQQFMPVEKVTNTKTVVQLNNINKIIEYMDSKNLFEINFVTQHSLDIGIVAPKSGYADMQLMTDHKVSDFVTNKSYHAVTLVSKYTVKATWDTMSVDPFCCSSNSLVSGTDVLRCELCVYPPALFEATGTMLQPNKAFQANTPQSPSTQSINMTTDTLRVTMIITET